MMNLVNYILFILLGLGLLLTVLRLFIGPTLSDRVVALDMLGTVVLGLIAGNVLASGHLVYLDVLVVVAIILFFGTIALARYIEKRMKDE